MRRDRKENQSPVEQNLQWEHPRVVLAAADGTWGTMLLGRTTARQQRAGLHAASRQGGDKKAAKQ